MSKQPEFTPACPLPTSDYAEITLAHGGGGALTRDLIERVFQPAFRNPFLDAGHDGAVMEIGNQRIALSTDSYVIKPTFFAGGDVGSLAIYGTVNDIAMCGARPLYLSAALIAEEGFALADLERVVLSMKNACRCAGVVLVTGDTKVVDKGSGDGIYITTTGIGVVADGVAVAPSQVREGDIVILSGDIGRHGVAVMATREGLEFETAIESDLAPLSHAVTALLAADVNVHCLRDLTRGGLASALVEIAQTAGLGIRLDEGSIPVSDSVRGACEILGLDPLYVANEGRFVAIVPASGQDAALAALRTCGVSEGARVIGSVADDDVPGVSMKTGLGTWRSIDLLSGEQLPRIC